MTRALVLVLVLVLGGPGCASETRRVETHLGSNARLYVDGQRLVPDAKGVVEIPVTAGRSVVRIEEPRKPAVVADVRVLVNPDPFVEDAAYFASSANTTIVYTGEKGGSFAGKTAPVGLDALPDPLTVLRDATGPFFGPPAGQGVILVVSHATAKAKAGGKEVAFEAARGGASLPAACELPPGNHTVRVDLGGYKPFETTVSVAPNEYRVIAVRLAAEGEAAQ